MARYSTRFKCGHDGCAELAFFEADTRKEQTSQYERYANGKWRCVRHSRMDEVLAPDNRSRTVAMTIFDEPYGRFWGIDKADAGFVYGPGFKAFAKDFPPGTQLKVTAEVILPCTLTQEQR